MTTQLKFAAAEHIGGRLLDSLLGTVRVHRHNPMPDTPVIFALWHGRLLPLGHAHRGHGFVTMASASKDGEYIARVLRRWDYIVVRGSSSRGGDRALREMVGHVRAGRTVSLTPDGPRGPREQVKPGVVQLARLTGAPIVPVGAAATRAWWLVGWDRVLVPKPFAKLHIIYGDPIFVPRDADVDRATAAVKASLDALTVRAEAAVA